VFDPFAGSGTTGVAALWLGRHFIGCEIEEDSLSVAVRRLADCAQPLAATA
jgi:DNA modification methylase